jgi:hypothetical protein
MPPQQPTISSGIKWNEVTWYSKLGAIILFLAVVPTLCFYIGMQYELTQQSIVNRPVLQNQTTPSTASSTKIYSNTQFGFDFTYPTEPDGYGLPVDDHFSAPWLLGLIFCSTGSCGMGSGSRPDFGIQEYTNQSLLVDNLNFSPSAKLLSSSSITIGGYKGMELIFSYISQYPDILGQFREVNLPVGNRLFIFGLMDDKGSNSALFDSIVSTLHFSQSQ